MNIKLQPDTVKKLRGKGIKSIDKMHEWQFEKLDEPVRIEVTDLSEPNIELLEKTLKAGGPTYRRALSTLTLWKEARSGKAGERRLQSLNQVPALVREYMRSVPGHRVYKEVEDGIWLPYVVTKAHYTAPMRNVEAQASIELLYFEAGSEKKKILGFVTGDVVRKTVADLFTTEGYVPETPELRAAYESDLARFTDVIAKVGEQFVTVGRAHNGYRSHALVTDNEPTRVVVDDRVDGNTSWNGSAAEDDVRNYGGKAAVTSKAWYAREGLTGDDYGDDDDDDTKPEDHLVELPVHPLVLCFDLRRQEHVDIHVRNLTEYKYDPDVREKLVLSEEVKDLVEVLVENARSNFADIISGKAGGSIILCRGPPGTGKTLTAEVYGEVMERPLYKVQSSQLGVSVEKLEQNLSLVLRRASRWGAILLLDEADVYAYERGSNIMQNAVVGIFLRVLEYYQGVLFMTTNRSTLLDDAIMSRCTAVIDYVNPNVDDQVRIWSILSKQSNIKLPETEARKVATAHPNLSGRDVKNLLKLANLVALNRKEPVTAKTIEYVMRFKPDTAEGGHKEV